MTPMRDSLDPTAPCACGCPKDGHYGPAKPCDGGHACGTWWPPVDTLTKYLEMKTK